MGLKALIADVVRVVRGGVEVTDVRADSGGGINVTGEHFAPPGDDSRPLPDDLALMTRADGTSGEYDAVGYIDPQNAPESDPGEKRLYARDETTGAVVATVWLKNDGTVLVENALGSFEMQPSGKIVANGAFITITGDVWAYAGPGLAVSLLTHVHPGIGSPPTPVPPPP